MPPTQWRPARTPGRPPQLSREQIVTAALELDLDALTMPAVAARLQVSTQALYYWVANRDELVALIGEALVERVVPPAEPVDGEWRAWLVELAWGMFHQLLSIPGFTGRLFAGPNSSPALGRLHSRIVDTLVASGLDGQTAADTWDVFGSSILGWLTAHRPGEPEADEAPRRPRTAEEAERRFWLLLNTLLRGLPVNAPPARG